MKQGNGSDKMKTDILHQLIECLGAERDDFGGIRMPDTEQEMFRLYRSLVNIRPAIRADAHYLGLEDAYLTALTKSKGITDIVDLLPVEDGIYLWQGDITTLRCCGIVNVANSGMTGCWQPCHNCIDNCIHTFAGVRLRYQCHQIMQEQGHPEPTGNAKITPAYNLPCDYVIHTVGPIVEGRLNEAHCRLLERCYKSCLEIAVQNSLENIAFCCISTGVFGFPQKEAARIAVNTVRNFRKNHSINVLFNVFKDEDYEIYKELFGRN